MMNLTAHRAFSLLELLVAIAIIAIVTGLSIAGYGKFTAHAQNMRCVEFVHQTKTALEHLYQRDNAWPPLLQKEASGGDGKLDAEERRAMFKDAMQRRAALVKKYDKNGDGRLDEQEREEILNDPEVRAMMKQIIGDGTRTPPPPPPAD